MAFLRVTKWILLLALAAVGGVLLWAQTRPANASDDLAAPIGFGTARRLAGMEADGDRCRALLTRAGIAYRRLPAHAQGGSCGFADAIAWQPEGSREARYAPAAPALACPVAAALAVWEWTVVQPAAARAFGTTVRRIDHFGSYACRRIYGRDTGRWSYHARAEAIDIAGFHLADGRRITVAGDWRGDDAEARFLHAVRDGACRLFGTTLSPDYNAAHRDHLHLDGAQRGGFGYCR